MRRLLTYAVVVLAIGLLAPVSRAQVSGTLAGPQNTPAAPGAHAGVMPTPMGVSPAPGRAFPTPTPMGVPPVLPFPNQNGLGGGVHHHHHHPGGFFGGAYPVYVPVPVVVDPASMYPESPDPSSPAADDQSVVPGPTVFERRTPADMASPGAPDAADSAAADDTSPGPVAAASLSPAPAASQPAQPQDSSVLVFRDGHQLEIQNYAIVGGTLYDFTPGHTRKIPLSQLDLPATQKANDDRGVDFSLPASSANQ